MSGPAVTIVESGGIAVTPVDSGGAPMTLVESGGIAVTIVESGGVPFVIEGYVAGAPSNTVLPAVTGTPTVGETLTASTGTWTGSPSSYAYQWYADGVGISGATSSTYELTGDEEGADITVGVIATNGAGDSAEAVSEAVGPVEATPAPPETISDLTATAQSDTEILLEFTPAVGATSHEYRIDGGSPVACDDNTGEQDVTGLTADTEYDFEVRGVNGDGNGVWSNVATETTDEAIVPKVRLFLIGGDSNGVGRGTFSRDPVLDVIPANGYQYKNHPSQSGGAYRTFVNMNASPGALHHPDSTVPASDRYGPGEALLKRLCELYPDDYVVAVPCAVGGSSVATAGETWNPAAGGAGTPAQYNYFVDSAEQVLIDAAIEWPGLELIAEMVYFDLGANDAGSAVTGPNFLAGKLSLITNFQTDVPAWAGARWVNGGLPFDDIPISTGQQIERAILREVAELDNVYYVKSIDDSPDDGDTLHRNQATNRTLGAAAAIVHLDTTVPTWSGVTTFYQTDGRAMALYFAGDFAVVGSQSGGIVTVDGDTEVTDLFSLNRTLRWTANGTETIGTFTPALTIIGGNRVTYAVPLTIEVMAVGTISPVTAFTGGERGHVWTANPSGLSQTIDGATPVTTATQVVGWVDDLSPNADNFIAAANNTTRPTYNLDADSKHYLSFDGTNDVLLTTLPFVQPSSLSFTAGIAVFGNTQSAVKTVLSANSTSSTTPFIVPFQVPGANGNMSMSFRNDASAGGSNPTLTGMLDNATKRVLSAQFNGITRRMRNAADRAAGGGNDAWQTTTAGLNTPATVTRTGLGGNSGATPANFYAGRAYAGYAINRALTDAEIANFEDWMAAQTLTSALP